MRDHVKRMYEHFSKVSTSYNIVRTTDVEPILYIREKLNHKNDVRAIDVGCGGGRYCLLLFQYIPGLHLTCADVNDSMLAETFRYLKRHGMENFSTLQADVSDLQLPESSMDCIFSFNAIHHFDPMLFLHKAAKALKDKGYIFIYTRLKSQNARSIWGRFFPGFSEREKRLYDFAQVEQWMDSTSSIQLVSTEFFKFKRRATLKQLIAQAENKHYSTLSLYPADVFDQAVKGFKKEIRRHFTDLNTIEWCDENVMIVFRKG